MSFAINIWVSNWTTPERSAEACSKAKGQYFLTSVSACRNLKALLDIGDIVGAEGGIRRTDRGELSVVATSIKAIFAARDKSLENDREQLDGFKIL